MEKIYSEAELKRACVKIANHFIDSEQETIEGAIEVLRVCIDNFMGVSELHGMDQATAIGESLATIDVNVDLLEQLMAKNEKHKRVFELEVAAEEAMPN